MEISQNHSHSNFFRQTIFVNFLPNLLWKMRLFFTICELSPIITLWKMLIMNHFSILFSKILSYVPCGMLRIVSKLVKSTPWVLLRLWVDIGFHNWFWCTDSCTNWFALAIFRHIQAKNHNLQFRKMCFIVNIFSPLILRCFHEIFAKNEWERIPVISKLTVWKLLKFTPTIFGKNFVKVT